LGEERLERVVTGVFESIDQLISQTVEA